MSTDHDEDPAARSPASPQTPVRIPGLASAYVMIGAVLVGLIVGQLIDRAAGTQPLWTVILSLIFIGAGVYTMYREGTKK